ncbi:MAG: diguanylate cyclase, partial [Actinomycetota bacterium]|nr:diguanylate cyclase [Actinomycetota bacterium]
SIDLHVVAEGVETDGQYRVLAELGCDYAQGFLLGRPVPEEPTLDRATLLPPVPDARDTPARIASNA